MSLVGSTAPAFPPYSYAYQVNFQVGGQKEVRCAV